MRTPPDVLSSVQVDESMVLPVLVVITNAVADACDILTRVSRYLWLTGGSTTHLLLVG